MAIPLPNTWHDYYNLLLNQYNITPALAAVTTTEALDFSSDTSSTAIDASTYKTGSVQLNWTGLDAFNATVILQISDDNVNWNDWGGDLGGIILLDTPGSQVWEITAITANYIRLSYQANSVTTGTADMISIMRDR